MPPRKSKATHALQGTLSNNPAKNSPKFSGTPRAPKFLTPIARKEWRRVLAAMKDDGNGFITALDQSQLAAYCQAFGRWHDLEIVINNEGMTIKEPILDRHQQIVGHKVKPHPAVLLSRQYAEALRKFAAQFGFNPSNRAGLDVPLLKQQKTASREEKHSVDDLIAQVVKGINL
jgi:P27 family predicted phage terminase small subunit